MNHLCVQRRIILSFFQVFFILVLLFPVPASLHADEPAVVRVYVNTVDRGDFFVSITLDNDVLIQAEDILRLGLQKMPEQTVSAGNEISLSSMAPDVTFSLVESESAVYLETNPSLLEQQEIDLNYRLGQGVQAQRDNSAFFNYGFTGSSANDFNSGTASISLEAGVRLGDYLGLSTFTYAHDQKSDTAHRLLTSIIRDDPVTLRRYVAGDFTATSGYMGSSGTFGGLSLSKEYSMAPYLNRYPGLDLGGFVQTPSKVEVYIDDRLITSQDMAPGEFRFRNLPFTSGGGETSIVIRDTFGREHVISSPFYTSRKLLKPGLAEYSYNIGFRRRGLGQEDFNYSGPAFLGFHRYGLNRYFTPGFRAEFGENLANAGPSATILLGLYGEVDTSLAVSYHNSEAGYAGSLDYTYNRGSFSVFASAIGYSEEYATLDSINDENAESNRLRLNLGLGLNLLRLGSLNLSFSSVSRYDNKEDTKRYIFSYSKPLWHRLNFNARIAMEEGPDGRSNGFFVGLILPLGGNHSGSLDLRNRDGKTDLAASLWKNPPRGTGLSYRLNLETAQNDDALTTNADGRLQYNAPFGIGSVEYNSSGDKEDIRVNLSGAVTLIDGSVHLARPVYDGFALVRVDNLKNVMVRSGNQDVGITDSRGELLVPDLIAYYDNILAIEPEDIPLGYEITETRKPVAPFYRSGAVVDFPVNRLQAVEGKVTIVERGKREIARYWGLRIRVRDEELTALTGTGGEFYLENMVPGRYDATVYKKEKSCDIQLVIPKSDELIIDLGEIDCELD